MVMHTLKGLCQEIVPKYDRIPLPTNESYYEVSLKLAHQF